MGAYDRKVAAQAVVAQDGRQASHSLQPAPLHTREPQKEAAALGFQAGPGLPTCGTAP